MGALGRLRERIDPRRVNGGVFLGLNGTVDEVAWISRRGRGCGGDRARRRLAATDFTERLKARFASAGVAGQDAAEAAGATPGADIKDGRPE